MTKLQNPIQLGVIGAAHGIKGEVRVKTFTEDPLALGQYGVLMTEDGASLTVRSVRQAKTVVIVRFKEVQDRNAAELLNGKAVFVERDALPDTLDEEEFYHTDMMGLPVQDETGEAIGHVLALHNFGAGDMLEVRPRIGPSVFIPFTKLAVPTVDIKAGFITIDRELAGLVNKEEDSRALEEQGSLTPESYQK